MKRAWNCSSVEIIHSTIPTEEYNQILDEFAEVVYRHLCQLSENQAEAPETYSATAAERTGTHG